MKSYKFGNSVKGLPIWAHQFGTTGPKVLILGGVHGDEHEGVAAALGLLEHFHESFTYSLSLTIVPMLNVDGVLLKQRKNANSVDLNRNLPTKDWTPEVQLEKYSPGNHPLSEPENQALHRWVEAERPQYIYSLHSWKPVLIDNNALSKPECELLSRLTGYRIQEDIGYPTPGSLGTYGSVERSIPTLTYELERGMDLEEIKNIHVPALLEALKLTQNRF